MSAATPPAPSRRPVRLMREGDSVLLEQNGEKWAFVTLKNGATACIGKLRTCPLDPLIGAPFGANYDVTDIGILEPAESDVTNIVEEQIEAPCDDGRSNKHFSDTKGGDAQKLSADDIQRLRMQGLSGDQIVEQLCANSTTFSSKTAFAQEKYKMKKLKKHTVRVKARQPTARAICEAYFYKSPASTNYLRFDALSMLLNLGNIGAHAQPLIVENCAGLITAAAAERMSGLGCLCVGHIGQSPPSLDIVRLMNLEDDHRAVILTLPLSKLIAARRTSDSVHVATAAVEEEPTAGGEEATITTAKTGEENVTMMEGTSEQPVAGGRERDAAGWKDAPAGTSKRIRSGADSDVARFAAEGFTSLIMVAPALDPLASLRQLLPLLAPSAPFAVWCATAHPLALALDDLRTSRVAVNLALVEPFMREHQVLPGRTHPEMTTEAGTGGFVLSGIFTPVVSSTRQGVSNKKPRKA